MGDAMLSAAAGRLIELLEEQAVYHINLVRGAEDEVHSLAEELKTIKSVLDDAENRRFKNDQISIWLSKLERTSYEMEDVLDQWDYAILKHRIGDVVVAPPKQKVWSLVPSSSCLCFKKLVVRHEVATKILDVKSKLDEILKEKDRYSFVVSQPTDQLLPKSWRDSTSFTLGQVHGRDFISDTLVTKMMGDGDRIQVVSIVGVGGLGKTTIAQLVYNHTRLEKHFDLRIWVCVSDPFDLATIAKGIIENVTKKDSPSTASLETLWQLVTGFISGKKFLLVLDDVWTEEYGKWESLESYLRCGGEGSKILVTTRKRNVAKNMGTMDKDIHYPEMLSVQDCWLLMRRIAHSGKDDQVEFEDIGMEIAKKCNGLPLAARTLGSLLRSKSTLGQWEVVLKSDIWDLKEAEVELFPHLLLSYNELSPTLKRCFSYCAIYPKDFKIDVGELIGNWMAIGYLGDDSSNIEDRGREYFNILAMHSLFQEIDENESTGEIECKMHDIVHDFARFIRTRGSVGLTRANKCTTGRDHDPSQFSTVNDFRSLLWIDEESPPNFCDCLTSLRVLRMWDCNLQRIPQIMENFIHMRLLDLHGNELSYDDLKIIFKLYNLKTLDLSSCDLKEIPTEIGNLIHLRYFNLRNNFFLKKLPREIKNLIHLRNLDLCSVYLDELPTEIGSLINLTHLDLSQNQYLEELPKEIGNLNHLTHLDLSFNGSLKELPREIGNLIHLSHLDLHKNESLTELPREIGNLIHLTHLNLSENESLTELPKEIGNLIHLTHLNLSENESLTELPREIGNLIHLRELNLSGNKSLEKLPETLCGLHELQILNVAYCTRLYKVPDGLTQLTSLSSLVEFEGGSTWSNLGLLKNITHLGEFLSLIIRLNGDNDLESVVEDVREAKLRKKKTIKKLRITFEDEMDETAESSYSSRVRMDVMDALQPHPDLEELFILEYKGSKLPDWMVSPLNQLTDVSLVVCHHLTAFPSLGELPWLSKIWIYEMEELEIVGRDFLGLHECSSNTTTVSFPRLWRLTIQSCRKWKQWEDITAEEEACAAWLLMPRLTELFIKDCNELKTLPHRLIRKLSIQKLDISSSKQLQQRYGNKEDADWKSISHNNPLLQLR